MGLFLIAGGAGFIGRHLCRELLQHGHKVRVLDSLVEQVHGPTSGVEAWPEVDFIEADLRDTAAVREALTQVDGVFNLAAEVGVGQSMYEVERYVAANDLGTAVLMQEVIAQPVKRVVVASSMSLYGEGLYRTEAGERVEVGARPSTALREGRWEPEWEGAPLLPIPTDESKRPDLSSVYALSKYVQERLTLMLCAAYGIEGVALRLFNVFGPGQQLSNPYTGVLAIFSSRLLNGAAPLVFEDGQQRRDFVHVSDVARAFRLAMEAPSAAGQAINVGSGRNHSVAEVAALLATEMERPDLVPEILNKARSGDVRHCFADISRARDLLGFEPTRTLEDSLPELVDWLSGQHALDRVGEARRELEQRGLVV
ncbi:NAD-dependent epimerase/dehydratase family protein [Aquibaculum arenosum]|uniref:SDR family NAD(P)-dependent oxidoreductase n=1 Tax=Aquibaculum arenosum TaxID=3032591 RepID=A0ABT5YKJ6_9PROT|nr:SDR family NAD(P)-dependent oxidoreductase [Fodinicurvata sp. CAU 1616]MDF2095351.1 SDR family NAD(P)-dependent oxidoreductase [Fodinicurvata sp. CAU 1616]